MAPSKYVSVTSAPSRRNDATVSAVQGSILIEKVSYFERLAEKTKDGVGKRLRGDTLAMLAPLEHRYTGPWPPTTDEEKQAREKAVSAYMSVLGSAPENPEKAEERRGKGAVPRSRSEIAGDASAPLPHIPRPCVDEL